MMARMASALSRFSCGPSIHKNVPAVTNQQNPFFSSPSLLTLHSLIFILHLSHLSASAPSIDQYSALFSSHCAFPLSHTSTCAEALRG